MKFNILASLSEFPPIVEDGETTTVLKDENLQFVTDGAGRYTSFRKIWVFTFKPIPDSKDLRSLVCHVGLTNSSLRPTDSMAYIRSYGKEIPREEALAIIKAVNDLPKFAWYGE